MKRSVRIYGPAAVAMAFMGASLWAFLTLVLDSRYSRVDQINSNAREISELQGNIKGLRMRVELMDNRSQNSDRSLSEIKTSLNELLRQSQ